MLNTTMSDIKAFETYKDGDIIEVKHICTPNLPSRKVTYCVVNNHPCIKVTTEVFSWDFFFKVNFIA